MAMNKGFVAYLSNKKSGLKKPTSKLKTPKPVKPVMAKFQKPTMLRPFVSPAMKNKMGLK